MDMETELQIKKANAIHILLDIYTHLCYNRPRE